MAKYDISLSWEVILKNIEITDEQIKKIFNNWNTLKAVKGTKNNTVVLEWFIEAAVYAQKEISKDKAKTIFPKVNWL